MKLPAQLGAMYTQEEQEVKFAEYEDVTDKETKGNKLAEIAAKPQVWKNIQKRISR